MICTATLFAACAKEADIASPSQTNEDAPKGVTVLTAGIAETKTVLDGVAAKWTNGNQIKVNGTASNVLSLAEPAATADFTFGGTLDHPYKAIYPASAYTSESTITLPYTQTYVAGSFGNDAAAMYAYTTEGSNLSFHHLMCIVKVSVKRAASDPDTHDIKYVEFKSRVSSEPVSGVFSIDYTDGTLTASSPSDNAVRVTGAVSTDSGADFYIAVPAGTYSKGFTIKVCDSEGHYMEKSKTTSTTLEAGHIHPMASFEFVPTGTELETVITSASELTEFATNWNAGTLNANIVAVIGSDITFTAEESASYPGIATSTSNAFTGTFDGGDHTITFTGATKPLIAFLGSNGTVKKTQISGTFTFTGGATSIYVGSLVGNVAGGSIVTACSSDADVTVTGTTTAYSCFGGLIGRVYNGTASGCSFSGAILAPTTFEGGNITIDAGGVTGNISTDGKVNNSTMSGYVQWLGEVGNSSNKSGNLNLGGIAGTVAGKISACHVLKNESASFTLSSTTYNATLLVGGTADYTHYLVRVGGLAGRINDESAKVSGSDNAANIFVYDKRGNNNDSYTLYAGGLVGHLNNGELSDSDNLANGAITTMSAVLTQYAGGVIGYCASNGTVNNVTNSAALYLDWANTGAVSNNIARAHHIGGIIGYNASENLSQLSNSGNVTKNQVISNTNDASFQNIGGVIGYSTKNLVGADAIENAGIVRLLSDNGWTNTTNGVCIGGIVGRTDGSVSGVSTTTDAKVLVEASTTAGTMLYAGGIVGLLTTTGKTISGCTNNGEVSFTTSGESALNFTEAYYAGVLGASTAAVVSCTISNCTNNGYVHGGCAVKGATGTYHCAAGIAGRLYGTSLVESCHNNGHIYNDLYYNIAAADVAMGPVAGGIVGHAVGTDTDHRVTISECYDDASSRVRARRGSNGGIVGYAKWTNITGCQNNGTMTSSDTAASYYNGGICGVMVASAVSGCTSAPIAIKGTAARAAGGIAGWMDGSSRVSDSSAQTAIRRNTSGTASFGGVAGKADEGYTISSCTFDVTVTNANGTITYATLKETDEPSTAVAAYTYTASS